MIEDHRDPDVYKAVIQLLIMMKTSPADWMDFEFGHSDNKYFITYSSRKEHYERFGIEFTIKKGAGLWLIKYARIPYNWLIGDLMTEPLWPQNPVAVNYNNNKQYFQ